MNILLTGHHGLVGRHVLAALRHAGHTPTGFDLCDGDDLSDPAALERALTGQHAVIHAAARLEGTPGQLHATNVTGTQNLLDAAASVGIRRLVYISTADSVVRRAPPVPSGPTPLSSLGG